MEIVVLILLVLAASFFMALIALLSAHSNKEKISTTFKEISFIRKQLDSLQHPVAPVQKTEPQETQAAPPATQTPAQPPVQQAAQEISARAAATQSPEEKTQSLHEALEIAKRSAEIKQKEPAAPEEEPKPQPEPQQQSWYKPPTPPVMARVVIHPSKPKEEKHTSYDAPIPFMKKFLFNENSGELNVGKRLMALGGFIILFLAAIFFLRYMFQKGLITPAMQVGIIIAAGAVIAALGNFFCMRKIQPLGQILTALGMAIAYAAFVAGMSDLYDPPVFDKTTAFICLSIVALYGMGVSLAFNAPVIAFMSLLAGFAVPPLVSTGQNHREVLFIYVTILDIATLGLVFARQWRVLASVAMAGTYVLFIGWMNKHYTDEQSAGTLWWLIYFAALFIVMTLAWNLRRKVKLAEYQIVALLINGLIAIAISTHIFHGIRNDNSAFFAWITGGVYMSLAMLIRRRIPDDYAGRLSMFLLGLALATYGVPLYFGERIIFLIWSLEAVMLLAIGWMYRNRFIKGVSGAVMLLACFAFWLVESACPRQPADLLFINQFFGRFLLIAVAITAYGLTHGFFSWRNNVLKYNQRFAIWILVIANIVITTGILIEYALFSEQHNVSGTTIFHFFTIILLIQSMVFSGGGLRLKMPELATLGILTLAGAGDTALACFHGAPTGRTLILNTPFINAILWMVVCLYTAWDFKRRPVFGASMVVAKWLSNAVVITFWLLACMETYRYVFEAFGGSVEAKLLAGKWMMTIWSAYAAVVLVAGVYFFTRSLRYIAMIIMLIGIPAFFIISADRMSQCDFGLMFLLTECVLLSFVGRRTYDYLAGVTSLATLTGAGIIVLVVYGCVSSGKLPLVFNRPFLDAVIWIAVCLLLAFRLRRDAQDSQLMRMSNLLYAVVVGALLALLSHEVYRYVFARLGETDDAANSANIALTLVWTGYAAAMLTIGFIWRIRPLRYFSLVLLLASGVKFILVDSVRFESLMRIIASFAIGVIMLVTAGAYHKLSAYITKAGNLPENPEK